MYYAGKISGVAKHDLSRIEDARKEVKERNKEELERAAKRRVLAQSFRR